MASGSSLHVFTPLANNPPASNYAVIGSRNNHPLLGFDDATNWDAVFTSVLSRAYAAGGITVTIAWMAKTATTGNALWLGAFELLNSNAQDLDSDGFAATQTSSADAANGTSGKLTFSTIAFTDGSQMDSIAAGVPFRFKLTRNATSASDTIVGDCQVISVELKET